MQLVDVLAEPLLSRRAFTARTSIPHLKSVEKESAGPSASQVQENGAIPLVQRRADVFEYQCRSILVSAVHARQHVSLPVSTIVRLPVMLDAVSVQRKAGRRTHAAEQRQACAVTQQSVCRRTEACAAASPSASLRLFFTQGRALVRRQKARIA